MESFPNSSAHWKQVGISKPDAHPPAQGDLIGLGCILKGPQVIPVCMEVCSKQLSLWKCGLDVHLKNLF